MSSQPYYHTGQDGIVVVQGTVVEQPPKTGTYKPEYQPAQELSSDGYHQQPEVFHGEKQQKKCNDVIFAILFCAHLGVIAWTTAAYAPAMTSDLAGNVQAYQNRMLNEDNTWTEALSSLLSFSVGRHLEEGEQDNGEGGQGNGDVQYNMAALWLILGVSAVVGLTLSTLFLSALMRFAETLIKFALFFNILTPLLMAILSLLVGAIPLALLCLMAFAFTAYYAYVVWGRIPFAAANMRTAVTAVRANMGLTFFAFNSLVLCFFWSLWWAIAAMSTIYVTNGCSAEGCESEPGGLLVFGLLISYYWTVQVIKNVCHVTVCGTVGMWWFAPHESGCCAAGVRDSFCRAITYSFGSICLGSLIVAIIEALKQMARQAREQGDSLLMCIADCILGCIESIVEYFNTWAYVYVALYNYSFMEAGKNVITLFRERGWTTIITDMLIDGVLGMVSLAVGAITGAITALVVSASGLSLGGAEAPSAFLAGFVIGALFASTVLGVISSAVNTVIVCYAEAPNEFQQNHPQLSEDMRLAWRQAWPQDFTY